MLIPMKKKQTMKRETEHKWSERKSDCLKAWHLFLLPMIFKMARNSFIMCIFNRCWNMEAHLLNWRNETFKCYACVCVYGAFCLCIVQRRKCGKLLLNFAENICNCKLSAYMSALASIQIQPKQQNKWNRAHNAWLGKEKKKKRTKQQKTGARETGNEDKERWELKCIRSTYAVYRCKFTVDGLAQFIQLTLVFVMFMYCTCTRMPFWIARIRAVQRKHLFSFWIRF